MIFRTKIGKILGFTLCFLLIFVTLVFSEVETNETEIEFDEGVPMPPVVRPVIILSGSDYEIGYQYFTQLIQIFGRSMTSYQYDVEGVYRRDKIHQDSYSEGELCALKKVETSIAEYAPEWIDILYGMADAAKDNGLDITFTDLLHHFTLFERMSSWGPHKLSDDVYNNDSNADCNLWEDVVDSDKTAKVKDNIKKESTCSGFAAWGNTTKDGKLLVAGSGDDAEGNFAATVIVFPKTGNNYITQTFNLVSFGGFPNHPNMNNKGLVRIHHAGSTFTKNEAASFSALPRGLVDMHTIRFADNSEEALDLFMTYSLGYASTMGQGIFYADVGVVHDDKNSPVHHVYNVESRVPLAIRYPGDNGEGDFIYATNNWFSDILPKGGLKTPHGGYWYEDSWYWWSVSRNNIIYDLLSQNQGKVDVDFMKMMYRYPSKVNENKMLEEIDAEYWDGDGSDYNASVGSLENSCIAIAVPDNGNNGVFHVSTGAVGRLTGPAFPGAHQYQPEKTWTFFELKLAESPEAVMNAAKSVAEDCMGKAKFEYDNAQLDMAIADPIKTILTKAENKYAEGKQLMVSNDIYTISKATRCFTAAQAFANQVYEVFVSPKTQP